MPDVASLVVYAAGLAVFGYLVLAIVNGTVPPGRAWKYGYLFLAAVIGLSMLLSLLMPDRRSASGPPDLTPYLTTERSGGYGQPVCAGPPLKTLEMREAALQAGYWINYGYDCITKESLAARQQEAARRASAKPEPFKPDPKSPQ